MKKIILSGFMLIGIVISACAPKVVPAGKATSAGEVTQVPQVIEKEDWQGEWKRVQQEAKREGKIVVYTTGGPQVRKALAQALKEFGLEMEGITARGVEIAEKVLRERKAGIFDVDLIITAQDSFVSFMKPAGILAPIEPLLMLPEVKDRGMWYKGQLPFTDKDKLLFGFVAYVDGEIHINTDLVRPGEITSLKDLLSPRWRGKIIMDDPTTPGRGNTWMTVVTLKMGEDYIEQLAKQEPVITRDKRQEIDWVAKGRFPVGIGITPEAFLEYKNASAPVALLPLDLLYLTGGPGVLAYLDRAPHPNAAKVFSNFFLSRKGQTIWEQTAGNQSARIDTPIEYLKEQGRLIREPGIDYWDASKENFSLELRPRAEKIFTEPFRALKR